MRGWLTLDGGPFRNWHVRVSISGQPMWIIYWSSTLASVTGRLPFLAQWLHYKIGSFFPLINILDWGSHFSNTRSQRIGMTRLPSCPQTAPLSPLGPHRYPEIFVPESTQHHPYIHLWIWALCLFSIDSLLRVGTKLLEDLLLMSTAYLFTSCYFSTLRERERGENASRTYTHHQA